MKLKSALLISLLSLLFVGQSNAAMLSDSDKAALKQCANIANVCKSAGYTRNAAAGKRFWQDCMKPILMGKSVQGVTVDANDVSACKTIKINKMQQDLQDMQNSK